MRDVLVLCYHAVSPRWPADLSLSAERLEAQLGSLVRRGWCGATFSQAVTAPTARRTLAVTFDDAYRSVVSRAAPVLEGLGLPATVFAPTGWVGRSEPMRWEGVDQWLGSTHQDELLPATWPQLGDLASRGWEIGSHTVSHPHLTGLDDHRLEQELSASRAECEAALGLPCRAIAYPYGDVDDRVERAARAAGYQTGAALPERWHAGRALRWPRAGIYQPDGALRFALKCSPWVRRARAIAAP